MARSTFRKVITSPELIEKINPKNKKIVDRFIKNFNTKRSDGSVISYISNYNIFFVWNLLHNENKFFIDIKKSEMMDFFDFGATELRWSPNRYSQMWSSLSSLSNYIENILDEEFPNFRNIVKKIEKLPKNVVREKSVFTKEELDNLANWLNKKGLIQEICLLKLIMSSGSRASELLRFTTDLIDINNTAFEDLFLETTKEMQVKGRGKTGKRIYRYIIKDLFVDDYRKWIEQREKIMNEHNQDHIFVFIKRDGTPAKLTTIRSWMEKWEIFLMENYGKIWYPHSGRHFWTTYLLKIGLEESFVQELQSWSTADMVKIYNDLTAKDRKWKGLDKLKNHLDDKDKDETILNEVTEDTSTQ
jgi:integrase